MKEPAVSTEFLRRKIAELDSRGGGGGLPPESPIGGGEEPPQRLSGVLERVNRLEGTFEGYKLVLAAVVTIFVGATAFLGVQATRLDGKISNLTEQVNTLPARINADIRDLTRTLADSITAAKQTPPQVILLPAPPSQQSSKP
jgi:hypothetical protein